MANMINNAANQK